MSNNQDVTKKHISWLFGLNLEDNLVFLALLLLADGVGLFPYGTDGELTLLIGLALLACALQVVIIKIALARKIN
jgi:hypothetical protein